MFLDASTRFAEPLDKEGMGKYTCILREDNRVLTLTFGHCIAILTITCHELFAMQGICNAYSRDA